MAIIPRFESFHVHRTSYKQIGENSIDVAILVPKDLKPGKIPLFVKFHGGGLILGDCLYEETPDWFNAYLVPFIHRTNSIVVLPNYRLTPEHTGEEILEDLSDFWTWFRSDKFASFLESKQHSELDLDYEHVLVNGESAGGYMAFMSGFTQPKGSIKAILAQYPMTNYLRWEPTETFFEMPSPPASVVDNHIASIQPNTVLSSTGLMTRAHLFYGLAAYGRFLEFFGTNEKLWPIHLMDDKDYMPPSWIVHGDADIIVSVEDTLAFVKKWEQQLKGCEVKLDIRAGKEHGFDGNLKEEDEKWLADGLAWLQSKWLN